MRHAILTHGVLYVIGHLGVTLRIGLRVAVDDALLADLVADARGGVRPQALPGSRWQLDGDQGPIAQMLVLRRTWHGGEALQVDLVLSAAAHEHGRAHGRYLGEAWMLRLAESLLHAGRAALLSLTRGTIWEDGAVDELEALDLQTLDGALLIGARVHAALQPLLQRDTTASATGLRQQLAANGGLWLRSPGWFERAWEPWSQARSAIELPWCAPPLEECDGEDEDDWSVAGSAEAASAAQMPAFLDAIAAMSGRLDPLPRVRTRAGRAALDEPSLRLLLCAQRRRKLGAPLALGVEALLSAPPALAAQLQLDMLGAVYLLAVHGPVRLLRADASLHLAFRSQTKGDDDVAWRRPWIEAYTRCFVRPDRVADC